MRRTNPRSLPPGFCRPALRLRIGVLGADGTLPGSVCGPDPLSVGTETTGPKEAATVYPVVTSLFVSALRHHRFLQAATGNEAPSVPARRPIDAFAILPPLLDDQLDLRALRINDGKSVLGGEELVTLHLRNLLDNCIGERPDLRVARDIRAFREGP